MIPVGRTALMYLFLFLLLRLTGKRTLAQITVFDFILLLVMSEATQQALTGNDFSVTNAMLIVFTLIAINRLMDYVSHRWTRLGKALSDQPVLLVNDGHLLTEEMKRNEVSPDDILEQARRNQGLMRLDQIRYAVLERSGEISIIPRD